MSNYVKITDYAAKDALLSGNPAKIVAGAEIGADFDAVAVAVATKLDTDATLTSLALLGTAADKIPYTTGINTWAGTPLTSAARSVLDDTTVGAMATTLGLGTGNSPEFTAVNIGHASNTTITQVSAGVIAVEGNTVAMLAATETFTAPQRGTLTTDNDLSFDLNVTNNFFCTPSAGGVLTFTNHASGQSGFIKLVNGANYAITAAASTKVDSAFLATISFTGTYLISYLDDGTNAYCVCSKALA